MAPMALIDAATVPPEMLEVRLAQLVDLTAQAIAVAREALEIAQANQQRLERFDELLTEFEPLMRKYSNNPAARFMRSVKGTQGSQL